jgi:hypothetical protein
MLLKQLKKAMPDFGMAFALYKYCTNNNKQSKESTFFVTKFDEK